MTNLDKEQWASILKGTKINIEDVTAIISVPYGYWVVTDDDPEIWIGDDE